MREVLYTITYNRPLTADVWEMRLAGNTGAITAPGQFINLRLEGLFLRRPISVYHWDQESLTIIYKVVGRGTEALAAMGPGQKLDALCGLGNGFDVSKCGRRTLLIGGGVGVPPLYGLARALLAAGKKPAVLLGFNTKSEVFCEKAFAALGVEMIPALGEVFDPNRHNAVMHVDDPEAGESTVVEVFQQGFICGEKVIRFAMVKVAN